MADTPTTRKHDSSEEILAMRQEMARLGDSRSWASHNPGKAFTILSGVGGAMWIFMQAFTANAVSAAVNDEQTKVYRGNTDDFKEAAKAEHERLRESIRDVGMLSLEQDRSTRQVLQDLATQQGVKVRPKSEDLDLIAAEKKVRGY